MGIFLNLWNRLFKKRKLIPYNHNELNCPKLEVGDEILTITDNDSYNINALSLGIDPKTPKDIKRKWKVISIDDDGEACLESVKGKNRTLTKYLKWEDGNGVRCKPHILHTEMYIRFYKIEHD